MLIHFFKGLGYLWKDKWTLISRVIIPLFLTVLILSSTLGFISKGVDSNLEEIPLIAVFGAEHAPSFIAKLEKRKDMRLITGIDLETIRNATSIDSIQMGMEVEPDFENQTENGQSGVIRLYFNSGQDFLAHRRIKAAVQEYEKVLLKQRLDESELSVDYFKPLTLEEIDSYSPFSFAIQNIAGFVTLIMIFFGLLATIYASLDFATSLYGKTPAAYLGRLLSIVVIGTLFSLFSYLVLKWALNWNPAISKLLVNSFESIITKTRLAKALLLLLPCMLFFASFFTWVGLAGKSFKRAQNTLQPIKLLSLFMLIWAILPSCQLVLKTVFVPVLSTAVSIREIFSGSPYSSLMWVAVGLLGFYSLTAMLLSRRYIVEK
ncbi:MAG: hypothetical protein AAF502_14105 [Bacteroidota bacterium]